MYDVLSVCYSDSIIVEARERACFPRGKRTFTIPANNILYEDDGETLLSHQILVKGRIVDRIFVLPAHLSDIYAIIHNV